MVVVVSGCSKKDKENTIVTTMTASIGTSISFNSTSVKPALIKPQLSDSVTSLEITGWDPNTGDKIVLRVKKFKNGSGTFSVADSQSFGTYYHAGGTYPATSGFVGIKDVGDNTITGYFNFTTAAGYNLTDGNFVAGKPWAY